MYAALTHTFRDEYYCGKGYIKAESRWKYGQREGWGMLGVMASVPPEWTVVTAPRIQASVKS